MYIYDGFISPEEPDICQVTLTCVDLGTSIQTKTLHSY